MSTPCTLRLKLAIPSDQDGSEKAPEKLYLLTLALSLDIMSEEDCENAILSSITLAPTTSDGGTSPGTSSAVMPPQDPPLATNPGDMFDETTH
jgi:hypothetical protein